MPRPLPREVAVHLEKAKESVIAAVDSYNRSGTRFRSGSYIVLMCIGWTALLHAVFFQRKVKPFYRDKQNPKRYARVDGDYKAWELTTCLDQYYEGKTSPVVENLRFLIGLRNKIEHRSMPELDCYVFGECQACLFNFEDVLLAEFGSRHCLTECLSLAVQFSRLRNEEQSQAVARLHRPLRADIRKYIDTFRSSLSNRTTDDLRYSYKVFLIPKLANHQGQADVAVEFVKFDPAKPGEMEQYEKLTALIKPAVTNVVNAGRLKAGDVCKRVEPVVREACGKGVHFSHAVTTGTAVRVEPQGNGFAIHGTPADCVRVGLHRLCPDAKFVLSGINHGGNLGADVYYSGTVAAVREAVLHGWTGVALSHYRKREMEFDWERASGWAARVLADLLSHPPAPGAFYNVNLPHLRSDEPDPEVVFCPLDPHPLPLSYRHEEGGMHYDGDYHARERTAGADVDVCFDGRIAVTLIKLL